MKMETQQGKRFEIGDRLLEQEHERLKKAPGKKDLTKIASNNDLEKKTVFDWLFCVYKENEAK